MAGSHLDARARDSSFRELEARTFDLVVIGGGITGAGVARDAALRGLSVAVLEAGDFGRGTSSRSSKMIHGGLRYLAQGDTELVREAASERQVLRRIAPHLTRLAPFLVPATSLPALAKLRAGLWMFEKLGQAPADERHEALGQAELARREPLLRAESFAGAAVYPEFLTDDSRLVMANLRAAAEAGAVVVNYAQATELAGEPLDTVVCRSTLPGEDRGARVRAAVVLNAAGPWVDGVRALEDGAAAPRLSLTKGIHVVLPHDRAPVVHTVIMRTEDKRGIFAVPRDGLTYIGTTDTFYPSADAWPKIEAADVDYLLRATGRSLKVGTLTPDDVTAAWAGVRPLIAQPGKAPGEISRRDEVWTGPRGMITIAGGKLSAYRAMAERIVDQVAGRLGRKAPPAATAEWPLPGGDYDPASVAAALAPLGAAGERLVRLYGAEAEEVARDGGDAAAEARFAVLREGALRLEDYWVRRSPRLWFTPDGGLAALEPAADAMAGLLGWDADRRAAEIDACRKLHDESLAFARA